jgi:hypothetical protein
MSQLNGADGDSRAETTCSNPKTEPKPGISSVCRYRQNMYKYPPDRELEVLQLRSERLKPRNRQ